MSRQPTKFSCAATPSQGTLLTVLPEDVLRIVFKLAIDDAPFKYLRVEMLLVEPSRRLRRLSVSPSKDRSMIHVRAYECLLRVNRQFRALMLHRDMLPRCCLMACKRISMARLHIPNADVAIVPTSEPSIFTIELRPNIYGENAMRKRTHPYQLCYVACCSEGILTSVGHTISTHILRSLICKRKIAGTSVMINTKDFFNDAQPALNLQTWIPHYQNSDQVPLPVLSM